MTSTHPQRAETSSPETTKLHVAPAERGLGLYWSRHRGDGEQTVLEAATPVIVETVGPGLSLSRPERIASGYDRIERTPTAEGESARLVGSVQLVDSRGTRYQVEDRWTQPTPGRWRVDRRMRACAAEPGVGVRLLLEVSPGPSQTRAFGDFTYFAPGAMYDLNDLNRDGVDDYSDTQTLLYREDRLTAMSVLAHHRASDLAFALSRADVPSFDPTPNRRLGQTSYFQATDIGSVGVFPDASPQGGCVLTGAYPFVERERSHALVVSSRPAWGAYWPVEVEATLTVSYLVEVYHGGTAQQALWKLWLRRLEDLGPRPVMLDASLQEITAHRVDALLDYYAEDPATTAAGFVTNCHPQDGHQLGNIIQYGFTGQNLLNALCLLRAADSRQDTAEVRRRALRVIDFYVEDAQRNPHGLVHGLYNMDLRRYDSWWTGLLLPLAYAQPGDDLEHLMGPLYERLRPVIERLQGREGTYLRCLAEEYDALLRAYKHEHRNNITHDGWLAAANTFAAFLAGAQQADGSWFRGYDLNGAPLTDPDFWFGQTDVQRKSSTATVVPFLLRLHRITGDSRWLDVAARAGRFVYTEFVDGLKFNGGIHDSMYAKPQLVDHESIIFAFRALLELHRTTGEHTYLDQALEAAWIVCTWAFLWDVPLPEESTYARFGFRSTGWTGCDAPGAGYIHPMGVVVVPDLVEVARLSGEQTFLRMAELILAACNENVALPGKDWGYARLGLQEEGLQVSWCWADDPMFNETGFGGRRKGEGNKTCFPWISAATIWAHQELLGRYGTADVHAAGRISDHTRVRHRPRDA